MIKNGIARIMMGVHNLSESLAFYRDIIKMSVVSDHPVDTETIEQLWNLPQGTTGRAVCLKNEEQTTLLELIEFKPHSDKFIRSDANTWDYGLFTIAFRAKDVDAAYHYFQQQGYKFICPPITYTPNWVPVTVKEAIMVGPNETPIALIERLSEPKPVIKGDFGILLDSSQLVADMEEVTKFYVDILGFNKVFDKALPDGMIDNILNLPAGTQSRMAFINQSGSNNPALEFIHCSVKGEYLSDVAKPPNLGLFAITFQTDDLSALIAKLQSHDIKIISGPVICSSNQEKAILVEGPNRVNLQFFEQYQ
ncbi:MAG: VOC family protein [Symploca sp. SIO1C2]|nr:VOC family protein [Symploca sp. SIO1C2]NER48570.1 VOC family protein [Symploca sp. SIO1A3]